MKHQFSASRLQSHMSSPSFPLPLFSYAMPQTRTLQQPLLLQPVMVSFVVWIMLRGGTVPTSDRGPSVAFLDIWFRPNRTCALLDIQPFSWRQVDTYSFSLEQPLCECWKLPTGPFCSTTAFASIPAKPLLWKSPSSPSVSRSSCIHSSASSHLQITGNNSPVLCVVRCFAMYRTTLWHWISPSDEEMVRHQAQRPGHSSHKDHTKTLTRVRCIIVSSLGDGAFVWYHLTSYVRSGGRDAQYTSPVHSNCWFSQVMAGSHITHASILRYTYESI